MISLSTQKYEIIEANLMIIVPSKYSKQKKNIFFLFVKLSILLVEFRSIHKTSFDSTSAFKHCNALYVCVILLWFLMFVFGSVILTVGSKQLYISKCVITAYFPPIYCKS